MLTLVSDNDNVPIMTAKERGYSIGFGRGLLDKCSGEPARELAGIEETDYNVGYVEGYCDAYCMNDVNDGG